MFAQVKFDINSVGQMQLLVPSESVQNLNTRTVVFVPDAEKRGHYLIKDIKVSEEKGGFIPVLSGLAAGDIVVGKGAFVLKSKALKGQFGEDE